MNLHSSIKMTGNLSIKKWNKDQELVLDIEVPNLVVTSGKQYIANRIASNSISTIMSYMGIGNNSTAASLSNTDLLGSLYRNVLTSTTVNGSNITYVGVFAPGEGTGTILEAGIFNANSAGTMLCRTTFPSITKSITDTIAITWTVTVG